MQNMVQIGAMGAISVTKLLFDLFAFVFGALDVESPTKGPYMIAFIENPTYGRKIRDQYAGDDDLYDALLTWSQSERGYSLDSIEKDGLADWDLIESEEEEIRQIKSKEQVLDDEDKELKSEDTEVAEVDGNIDVEAGKMATDFTFDLDTGFEGFECLEFGLLFLE